MLLHRYRAYTRAFAAKRVDAGRKHDLSTVTTNALTCFEFLFIFTFAQFTRISLFVPTTACHYFLISRPASDAIFMNETPKSGSQRRRRQIEIATPYFSVERALKCSAANVQKRFYHHFIHCGCLSRICVEIDLPTRSSTSATAKRTKHNLLARII